MTICQSTYPCFHMSMIIIIQCLGQYRVLICHRVIFAFLTIVTSGDTTGIGKVFGAHGATEVEIISNLRVGVGVGTMSVALVVEVEVVAVYQ